jgi:hypothetical protein
LHGSIFIIILPWQSNFFNRLNVTKKIWSSRYPCGEHGGWINYRGLREEDVLEAVEFIKVKVKTIAVTNK